MTRSKLESGSEDPDLSPRILPPLIVAVLLVSGGVALTGGYVWYNQGGALTVSSSTSDNPDLVSNVEGPAHEPNIVFEKPIPPNVEEINVIQPNGHGMYTEPVSAGATRVSVVTGGGLYGPPETGTWKAVVLSEEGEVVATVEFTIAQKDTIQNG